VETLIFGRAVERATQPERIIVGCANPEAGLPVALRVFLESFHCAILPMRFESAELTKISINCCLAASVTVANTLAELCERIGADWSEIAPALRLDKRIGSNAYLAPGLGISGGNLERDLMTVIRLSQEYGTEAGLIHSFVKNSAHRKDWALQILHQHLLASSPEAVIGVLGLAYKENTNSVKNSPGLALVECLRPWKLRLFDPVVPSGSARHRTALGVGSALEAADGADALAIMTPWPEFREISCSEVAHRMRGRLVIDPYRILDRNSAREAGLDHRCLGVEEL
jgi:UDPglucose 6-dehydrogenase